MWQKEIKFADGIIRDYLGGPSPKNRRGGTKREVKLIQCKKDSPISVNLEEEGATSQDCRQPLMFVARKFGVVCYCSSRELIQPLRRSTDGW